MKLIKIICCIAAISVILSGCNLSIASSIEDLISPVAPFGDNASVQKAMDNYVKGGYSLKTPTYGDYITSYIFKDIDCDGIDDAICFYEPSDDLGSIYMAILKQINNDWSVVCSAKGNGKDIYSVDFVDINSDSSFEIVSCWDTISNSTIHNLSLYSVLNSNDSVSINEIGSLVSINNYHFVDFDNDGITELFALLNSSTNSASAKGQLYSINDKGFYLLGETKLDGHITTYTKISSDVVDGKVRIYADAISSTGDSMLTEIIFWSDHYNNIISPFYSYSTGTTKGTNRSVMIDSLDIDNDGLTETPLDANFDDLPNGVDAIDWKAYKNSVLIHNAYSLFVENDKYLVVIPDDMFSLVRVSYDEQTRTLTVSDNKTSNVFYSITSVLKSAYNDADYNEYEMIAENKGYYYLAKFGDNSSIDTQQLRDLIKSY